jgi:hypothetical protein
MGNLTVKENGSSMTVEQKIDYLDSLPLEYALWWFIENVNETTQGRTDMFFFLRERMRDEAPVTPAKKRGRPSRAARQRASFNRDGRTT